jgi:hypothetical protein
LFGTLHLEVHVSFGSNGSSHFNLTADAYGLDVNLGPSQTADFIDRLILNAQGTIDNFYAYDHLRFTVNANGVPTVSFDTPTTGCNG